MAYSDFVLRVKDRFAEFWKLAVPNEETNKTASEEKLCGLMENLIQDLKSIQSCLQQNHEKVDTKISEQLLLQAEAMDVEAEVDVTTADADKDDLRLSVPNSTALDSSMFDADKDDLRLSVPNSTALDSSVFDADKDDLRLSVPNSTALDSSMFDADKDDLRLSVPNSTALDSSMFDSDKDDLRLSVPNSTALDSLVFDATKEALKNNADKVDMYNDKNMTGMTNDNVSTCTSSVPNKDQSTKQKTLKMENVAGEEENRMNKENDDGTNKLLPLNLNLELATIQKSEAKLDPNLVQIRASKSEIERRIAAFIEQKRVEVDEENQREFCSHMPALEITEDSCARTDAVFYPRAGGKSHIKVSRVINVYGPQTQRFQTSHSETIVALPFVQVKPQSVPEGVEERVANMEVHLKMKNNIPKADMYSRLKSLESRILYLESLSPEYFPSVPPPPKRQRLMMKSAFACRDFQPKELSLQDIDERMKALRQSLLNKATETSQKISIKNEQLNV